MIMMILVMPNLPTKTIPAKIARLKLSRKLLVDMRSPPLEIKILLESPSEIQNLSMELGCTTIFRSDLAD